MRNIRMLRSFAPDTQPDRHRSAAGGEGIVEGAPDDAGGTGQVEADGPAGGWWHRPSIARAVAL
jgi:hypothetical protein